MSTDAERGPRHAVWLWAAACVPPLIIYARTMAPGLVARGDTPKFQFLGVVLGTAHEPGYPLFVLLSWVFSHLPWGTVAWGVNLMTLIFAVLAAGITAAAARRCGATPVASLLAALGLAFGPVFWAQATAAEVYTLATVFQAAVLALLMRWYQSRRDRDLLLAVAVSALALGHHPTFVMLTPALVAFVLVTDWRVITRLGVAMPAALTIAAGLAQYAFIVMRTHQRALYLEATAAGVRDLLQVLRGSQYSGSLFAFSIAELVETRIPLVTQILLSEVGAPGLTLSAIGLVSMLRSEWRPALLLVLSAATIFVFACTYDVEDTPVFCIPVFAVLWILAACGLGALARAAAAVRLPAPLVSAALIAVMVTLAVARGYASADRSAETYEASYLTSMFDQIEKPATIVVDYNDSRYQALAHALRYKLFVDRAGPARVAAFDEVPDPLGDPQLRRPVYAFDPAHRLLQSRGLMFARVFVPAPKGRPTSGGPPLSLYRSAVVAACTEQASDQWARFGEQHLTGPSMTIWIRSKGRGPASAKPAAMVMYVVSEEGPPTMRVEAGGAGIEVRATPIAADDVAENVDLATATGREIPQPGHRHAARFEFTIPAVGPAEPTALVSIAPRPLAIASQLIGAEGARVRVCPSPVDGRVLFGDGSERAVEFLNADALLSNGWRHIESSPTDRLRWTGSDRPGVHFTLAAPVNLVVSIDAAPLRAAPADRLLLVVNGAPLEAKILEAGRATYSWAVTAALLHAGYNRMVLMTPPPQSPKRLGLNDDDRLLGLAIRSWLLTRRGPQ